MVARSALRIACFSISSRGIIGVGPEARAVGALSKGGVVDDDGKDGGVEVGTIGGVEKLRGGVDPCGDGAAGVGAEKTGDGSGVGGFGEAEDETGMAAPTRLRPSVGRPSAAVETGRPVSERMTARSIVF